MPKRAGRKSAAQTPAPPKERIKGSAINVKGSASSKASAKDIKLSEQTITALKNKAQEYNKGNNDKVSLATLKAVYRRGSGAYSSSHRLTITGGVPNTRNAWAMARVNKFLKKKSGEAVKKAYVQDDDLLENGGFIDSADEILDDKTEPLGEEYILRLKQKYKDVASINEAIQYAKENNFEIAITKNEILNQFFSKRNDRFIERDLKDFQDLFDTNVYIEQDQEVALAILNSYFKFYYNNPNFKKIPLVIYQNTTKRGFGEGEVIEYDFLNNIFVFSSKKGYYDIIKSNTEPINGYCGFVYEKYEDKLIGAFTHEYGHYINSNNVPYIDTKWHSDNWEDIGKRISLYAQENRAEYLAEVFTLKNIPNFIELSNDTKTFIKNNYDDKIPKDKVRYALGGSVLLAPNGKPSNLTPEQWHLVRTPEFKSWFGNWENDPENASKVVDDNGEPMVVYHGTDKKFNIFNVNSKTPFVYFAVNHEYAKNFSEGEYNELKNSKIYSCFLNIRKPLDTLNYKFTREQVDFVMSDLILKRIEKDYQNGIITRLPDKYEISDLKKHISLFTKAKKSQQTTYLWWLLRQDGESSYVNQKKQPSFLKKFFSNLGYDGIVQYENIHGQEEIHYEKIVVKNKSYASKVYIVFEPNQIKLADGSNTTFDPNNPDIRYDDGGQTYNDKELLKRYKAGESIGFSATAHLKAKGLIPRADGSVRKSEKYKYKNGGSTLLAPNGKPSNLTPEQWHLVRTPEFKAWFGDWENDPKNASKVVDENGEPLVVYHGTNNKFFVFDLSKKKRDSGYKKDTEVGIYATSSKSEAFMYNSKYVLSIFANIRKPKEFKGIEFRNLDKLKYDGALNYERKHDYLNGKFVFKEYRLRNGRKIIEHIMANNSNQIKLADGSNTTFDTNNPDIRYEDGGVTFYTRTHSDGRVERFSVEDYEREHYGAGILFYCPNTNRILLIQRSEQISSPNKWGISGGGKEQGETAEDVAKRETLEEIGYEVKGNLVPLYLYKEDANEFQTFLHCVNEEFTPVLNWESQNYMWVELDQIPKNLHYAFSIMVIDSGLESMLEHLIACEGCGWSWQDTDTTAEEMFICHKCNHNNMNSVLNKFISPAVSLDEISAKHGVPMEAIQKEFEKGVKHELEHVNKQSPKEVQNEVASRIASHHIEETPDYYTKLQAIESKEEGGEVIENDIFENNIPCMVLVFDEERNYGNGYPFEDINQAITYAKNYDDFEIIERYTGKKIMKKDDINDIMNGSKKIEDFYKEGGKIDEYEVAEFLQTQREDAESLLVSDNTKLAKIMICKAQIEMAEDKQRESNDYDEQTAWFESKKIWEKCLNDVKNQSFYHKDNIMYFSKGGLAYGNSHDNGGIPLVVKSTRQNIEIEGGEGVINKRSMQMTKKLDFQGKKLTPCEIISKINEMGGGVKFKCADVKEIVKNDGDF